jgi:hypothetical protein
MQLKAYGIHLVEMALKLAYSYSSCGEEKEN